MTNRKHSIYTHCPKDWNYDVYLRTKITRTPCKRRSERFIPRVVKIDDLIPVDDKIINDEEYRNNRRHAVVIQDLVTQWTKFYSCKIKTSQETEKSLRTFMKLLQKQKVVYFDTLLEFDNFWKIIMKSSDIHASEIGNKRNYRTSCMKSQRNNISRVIAVWFGRKVIIKFHAIQMLSATCPRSTDRWKKKNPYEERFGESFMRPIIILDILLSRARLDHIWPDAWTRKSLKEVRSKNDQSRNQNSKMPEIWGDFFLLIQAMKIRKRSLRLQDESWRHQQLQQRHVKERSPKSAFRKPLFQKQKKPKHLMQWQDSAVLLKHVNPRNKGSN